MVISKVTSAHAVLAPFTSGLPDHPEHCTNTAPGVKGTISAEELHDSCWSSWQQRFQVSAESSHVNQVKAVDILAWGHCVAYGSFTAT